MTQHAEIIRLIELFTGSIGVILSVFFAVFLLINRRQLPMPNVFLALYLMAFSLRIGKSLYFNYFPINPILRNVFLGVLLTIGPSLWFYSTHLLHQKTTIAKEALMHYIPFGLVVVFCWAIPNDRSQLSGIFFYFLMIHMLLYSGYTLYWLFKRTVKKESTNKTLHWLTIFSMATLILSITHFLITKGYIPYYLGTAFLYSVVIIFLAIWALKNPTLFTINAEKYASSTLDEERALEHIGHLNMIMKTEKLYLDPTMSLSKLSLKMGITTKELSQVINQAEGINYAQYINHFRIEEVKRLLVSDAHKHLKIAAIAYDCGFNSISSFNTAFKKICNKTAIQFRQEHR